MALPLQRNPSKFAPTARGISDAQRQLIVEACHAHVDRFLKDRDAKALVDEKNQPGWLSSKVIAIARLRP
jgi:hypothetical protein